MPTSSTARSSWLIALLVVSTVLLLASYSAFKIRRGDWTSQWESMPLAGAQPDAGFAYVAPTGRPDLGDRAHRSPAQVIEDGEILFLADAPLEDIRTLGLGRVKFQDDHVYFATLDNSDPRTNGRDYRIFYPRVSRPASRALYGVTALSLLVTLIVAALIQIRRGTAALIQATGVLALYDRAVAVDARWSAAWHARLADPARRPGIVRPLVLLWIILFVALAVSEATFLTRTGQWTRYWTEEPITEFSKTEGFEYSAPTGHPELSAHLTPSPAGLYEDGIEIGVRNAKRSEIRRDGRGLYVFLRERVYFATSDNSDPRTNARHYTLTYPRISRTLSRTTYAITGLLLAIVGLVTAYAVRSGLLTTISTVAQQRLQRYGTAALVIASALSLVVIGLFRAFSAVSPLVGDPWVPVLLLNLAAAIAVHVRYGGVLPKSMMAAYLAALLAAYYLLTAWAPQRPQGCHTTVPTAPWDLVCTSGDSGSYYYGYAAGSTRQPLYPWFIGMLTPSDFVPTEYAKTAPPGRPKTDPADPLVRVVRTQIVVMLAASVIACVALMVWTQSLLAVALFVWLYDKLFFTAMELNVVLTEDLVQALMFLLLATFFLFAWRRTPGKLLLAGLFAGLAYLTRQASGYCALILVAMSLMGLMADWRKWWKPSAGAFAVFVACMFVPDFYTLYLTGGLGKQQESLQYQYRIAHAMQYAVEADLELMPDAETRDWLAAAIPLRDEEHRKVDAEVHDRYSRMVNYIAVNLYYVATPTGVPQKSPQFYMAVATPILKRHFLDYLHFGFDFWKFGVSMPGLARLGFYDYSPWLTYLVLGGLMLWLRNIPALVGATLVLCHWAGVALASLFAAPLARMVWASENLVLVAAFVLFWSAAMRLGDSAPGRRLTTTAATVLGRTARVN